MSKLREWLRPPRNLLIPFGVVLFLPAAALIVLGVRLLDQDRALARQRQGELLEHAADQAVRAVDQDLIAWKKRLADHTCASSDVPDDAVCVVIRGDRIETVPPRRVPYYPFSLRLKEPPREPFQKLEAEEFGALPDAGKALDISVRLGNSKDDSVRAGALLRQARILRALGRPNDALAAYAGLSRITSVSINGEPTDLVARRARCSVLYEQSRTRELQREAETLAADLQSGKWQLDRETYLYVAGLIGGWLGRQIGPDPQEEALAAALAWLQERRAAEAPSESSSAGVHALLWKGAPVTVLWQSDKNQTTAFLANARFLENHWLPQLRRGAAPAQPYVSGVGAAPPPHEPRVQRAAADTGLPWTLTLVGAPGQSEPGEFPARRRNLLAAMGAVLVLVAAGSYFLWRSVNRDLAVARLQSDFVSAVSHEFRTPLTALRQFNDLLTEEDGPTPEKRRRYYEAQTRATERLYRLVESLLDFARMEAGRRPYRFERMDAGLLVSQVTEEFRREAAGADFAITCHVDSVASPVAVDREAISRALWNLLDNAVKYSGASRYIEVEVTRRKREVIVDVCDHGIGIPSPEQKGIFEKFVRGASAHSGGIKGTGLGLAMVRHIVEAHGGAVNVSSVRGEGSTFTIALPVEE